MLIVCTIKRKAGTHTKMPGDGTVYSFLPNAAGDHVAEVANPAHIERLLAIDVYRPYGIAVAPPAPVEVEVSAAEVAAAQPELASMTMEELQAEYQHRFGRAAHPQSKYETLLKKLAEARLADG